MTTTTIDSTVRATRLLYAVAAVGALALAVAAAAATSAGWWVFPAFALAPDLAFLAGLGERGLERGQLPRRAVPVYNLVHRLWGPAALTVVALVGSLPSWVIVAALVWGVHVLVDRALGYGLRTRDGFQRG